MIIQYFVGEQGKYAESLRVAKDACGKRGIGYKLISKRPCYLGEPDDPRKDSTVVRLVELIADPFATFLDADTLIDDRIFDLSYVPGKPYIGSGVCGAYAIYGNGCREIFKKILDVYDKSKWCICCQYLISHKDEFNVFPSGVIKHLKLWGKR